MIWLLLLILNGFYAIYKVDTRTARNDELFPAERGKMLSDYIGVNAEFHVIKNGAHMPNVIKAKQFNKLFLEFLERWIMRLFSN